MSLLWVTGWLFFNTGGRMLDLPSPSIVLLYKSLYDLSQFSRFSRGIPT
jgi:hypothetical protein